MEEQLIYALAKDSDQGQHNWGPLDQLADEDVALFSNTLVGRRAPPTPKLQKGNSLTTSAVFAAANNAGLRLSLARQGLLDEGPQPQSKAPSFVGTEETFLSPRHRTSRYSRARNGELVPEGTARGR